MSNEPTHLATDVYVPQNLDWEHMGWGLKTQPEEEKRYAEAITLEKAMNANPAAFQQRDPKYLDPEIKAKWDAFQASKGYDEGSCDLTLVEEFYYGRRFHWLPQKTGSCFPAGTLVKMADGTHKPIEAINVFDTVVTAEGNERHVKIVMGREALEPLYHIKLWGHNFLKLTGEHPILTKRGYVKACEIQLGDEVAITKHRPQFASSYITTEQYLSFSASQSNRRARKLGAVGQRRVLSNGDVDGPRKTVRVYRTVPDVIELTKDFGWIIGIALAEGGTDGGKEHGNKMAFTFAADERDTLVAKLINLFASLFGIECSVQEPKPFMKRGKLVQPKSLKVVVNSVAWASCFKEWIGSLPSGKRIHADLLAGPDEFLQGVFEGWLDGDGWDTRKKYPGIQSRAGTTVSKQLALQMYDIANRLGLLPVITRSEPRVNAHAKLRLPSYELNITDSGKQMQCSQDEKHVWRAVRGIECVPFSGKVFNLEVDGDNSYVAEGIGVHNCTISNAFRMHFRRVLWELLLKGQLETPLGSTEYGSSCAAFYAPLSYGIAREIGGLKNGDGGFCGPTIESLMRGVLRCDNGKLLELLHQLQADGEQDFPEPRSNSVYRAFQSWKYNSMFEPFLTDPLLESVKVTNTDTLLTNLEDYKPSIMCSMLAVKKGGTHQGLAYFVADRGNTWAHNMAHGGKIVWKGRTFILLSNESWQNNLIYPIPVEEYQDVIFPRYRPEVQTMGEIGLQQAVIAA